MPTFSANDFDSFLEYMCYMAKVVFAMDRLLCQIGLSGRNIVPLLIGFGWSVTKIMATRKLSIEHDCKMTILLTPFMSCTAKREMDGVKAAFCKQKKTNARVCNYSPNSTIYFNVGDNKILCFIQAKHV